MSNYECKKCGETASSKCAFQRNVFPSDQYATMIGNALTIGERYRNERTSDVWEVTYTFRALVRSQDEDEAIKESNIAEILTQTSKETLTRVLCEHEWTIRPGAKCDFGCCVG